MKAFLRGVKSKGNDRNAIVKKAITTQLSETVKEIQLSGIEENILGDSLDVEEATNSLCCIIEAMFLHGLKDSLALRFRKVIADIDDRPEPNFWAPLLVISHREIIDQIMNAAQLNSEVGQCRAWVRIVLNDCLLSSYLLTLRQDSNILKSFYNTYAYVRDGDLLELAQKIIEGLEAVKTFTLPCYSSILNNWPEATLILAGVWSPTLRTCPVQTCIDVAQSSQPTSIGNSETASLGSMMSLHSRSSGIGNILAFNEDEAFKIILKKKLMKENSTLPNSQEHSSSEFSDSEQKAEECIDESQPVEQEPLAAQTLGNSLNRGMGWSFDESHVENEEKKESNRNATDVIIEDNSKSLEHSYNALIESYSMFSGSYIKTPDVKVVWERFEQNNYGPSSSSLVDTNNHEEMLKSMELSTDSLRNTTLMQQLLSIPKEKGLDNQNYECLSCKTAITVYKSAKGIINLANVCGFTGEYFCNDCMCEIPVVIPARVIHNWDYKDYRVSKKAFDYIEEIRDHPMIDLKTINPFIYSAVEEMAKLQMLRNQLNFLRAYLYTCRDPIIEEFQKRMWPREYMYEHVHLYSVFDLQQIPDLTLAKQLKDVVIFGKKHVLDCWLCSHKGFLCELCNNSKVIFPFDIENVYRCESCNAVFHNTCLNASKPCPKCKRRKERQDESILGVPTDEN